MILLDFDEFIWLLCYLSLLRLWKLTFLLKDFDDALEDYLASLFNKSESLDCLLLLDPMLFLVLKLILQLEFRTIRH